MNDLEFEQVVEQALKLTVAEQAKLLERVAAYLAHEVNKPIRDFDKRLVWTDEELADLLRSETPKTGAEIAAMLESGELETSSWSEMVNAHITDPVEWLKALRSTMAKKRDKDWNSE